MKPKSFNEITNDMVKSFTNKTGIEDITNNHAIDALSKALEVNIYGWPMHTHGLRKILSKLGIKSARDEGGLSYGGPLTIESLEATLSKVTFGSHSNADYITANSKTLKLWKDLLK